MKLSDLSKAFECFPHSLLIAKLHAYGFDENSIKYSIDYLNHRKQKIKISNTFSKWINILHGVPQGSILGPLILNIFLHDPFLFMTNTDLVTYADDNTPLAMGSSELEEINDIKSAAEGLSLWLLNYCMKMNSDKSHLICP